MNVKKTQLASLCKEVHILPILYITLLSDYKLDSFSVHLYSSCFVHKL